MMTDILLGLMLPKFIKSVGQIGDKLRENMR